MKKQKGFTLLELIVVIAIMGILATIAAPNYQQILVSSRMKTLIGEWRNAFYLAQNEAIRRKHQVTLCPSSDGVNCTGGASYNDGWIVFDTNDNRIVQDYPPILRNNEITIGSTGNVNSFTFLNNGRIAGNFVGSTIRVSSTRYPNLDREYTIDRSGRLNPVSDKGTQKDPKNI